VVIKKEMLQLHDRATKLKVSTWLWPSLLNLLCGNQGYEFTECYSRFTYALVAMVQHSSKTSDFVVLLLSCRRGPSDCSRQNRRQLCTVSSRGSCSCSERLTSLPSPRLHWVGKKGVLNEGETKLALVPFLTWCHYEQYSTVHELSHQHNYLSWSSQRNYFMFEFEETSPVWSFI
jgi:hypothetical protein